MKRILRATAAGIVKPHGQQIDDDASLTISEFCALERLSLASFHKLRKLQLAPETVSFPNTRIVRISARARRAWHERMQALQTEKATQLESERRRRAEQASIAGRLGAQSPSHPSRRRRQAD